MKVSSLRLFLTFFTDSIVSVSKQSWARLQMKQSKKASVNYGHNNWCVLNAHKLFYFQDVVCSQVKSFDWRFLFHVSFVSSLSFCICRQESHSMTRLCISFSCRLVYKIAFLCSPATRVTIMPDSSRGTSSLHIKSVMSPGLCFERRGNNDLIGRAMMIHPKIKKNSFLFRVDDVSSLTWMESITGTKQTTNNERDFGHANKLTVDYVSWKASSISFREEYRFCRRRCYRRTSLSDEENDWVVSLYLKFFHFVAFHSFDLFFMQIKGKKALFDHLFMQMSIEEKMTIGQKETLLLDSIANINIVIRVVIENDDQKVKREGSRVVSLECSPLR